MIDLPKILTQFVNRTMEFCASRNDWLSSRSSNFDSRDDFLHLNLQQAISSINNNTADPDPAAIAGIRAIDGMEYCGTNVFGSIGAEDIFLDESLNSMNETRPTVAPPTPLGIFFDRNIPEWKSNSKKRNGGRPKVGIYGPQACSKHTTG
jgi:hypothetical protein